MSRPWLGSDAGLRHAHSLSGPAVSPTRQARQHMRAGRARKGMAARARSQSDVERAFASVQAQPKQIGSEYGEVRLVKLARDVYVMHSFAAAAHRRSGKAWLLRCHAAHS